MLVNTSWLLDYLEPHCSHDELLDHFTAAGLEVEDAHRLSEDLRGVVVGFVREVKPVEGGAGYYATRIEVAKGKLIDVLCASEHEVKVGWGVPVATAGTTLPSGVEIKAARYHGVDSQGMICLDGEMGMVARTTGLQVFDDESMLGKPLPEVVDIPELLVDLAVLPNRPDCLGMIGIARELAAMLGLNLKYPVSFDNTLPMAAESVVPVSVDDASLCPRYLAQVVRGVKVGPSPHWLKSRLLTAGKRPINNVVDITNFILLEWGQPLHAFDLSTLKGGEIRVRRMKETEELELLDETVIKGDPQALVIADAERPVALAGIMGGSATQTSGETTDVLIEAACFDSVDIRATARRTGVSSDSSYRFERGTDPNRMLTGAATRAAELVVELAGGRLDGACTEFHPEPRKPRVFEVTPELFSRHLGMPIDAATIRGSLEKLDYVCDESLRAEAPTWRIDANDPVALIEDVARIVGYDSIPMKPMTAATTTGGVQPLDRMRNEIAQALVGEGFFECRKAPLRPVDEITPREIAAAAESIVLKNPMRTDMTALRTFLIPSMLEVVEHNARHGGESFRFFEIDRAFLHTGNEPQETWTVALAYGGSVDDNNWSQPGGNATFFHLKGIVENILELAGVRDAEFRQVPLPSKLLVDALTTEIFIGGSPAGLIGQVEPALLAKSKLRTPIFVCELNLQALLVSYTEVRGFQGLARTPAVTRDLAFELPAGTRYADLEATARAAFTEAAKAVNSAFSGDSPGPRLEEVACIGLYEGKQIAEGRKSLTMRLVFREPQRTLTSEEATQLVDAVVAALTGKHEAKLRG